MQAVVRCQKGGGGGGVGHGPRRSMPTEWKLGMIAGQLYVIMYALFVNNIIYKLLCFGKKFLVHLTHKDVDRFRNGSVQKLYCLET